MVKMRTPQVLRRGLLVLAAILWLKGCVVGVIGTSTPTAPNSAAQGFFQGQDAYLEVCRRPGPATRAGDKNLDTLREVIWMTLVRDYGLRVHRGPPPAVGPYLFIRVIPDQSATPGWQQASMLVSVLTFAIVPGYVSVSYTLEFHFEAKNASRAIPPKTSTYQYRLDFYNWLPFIVYPDYFYGVVNAEEGRRHAQERVIKRFMYDAYQQMSGFTATGWVDADPRAWECPR